MPKSTYLFRYNDCFQLTHLNSPFKPYGLLMFSGGREKVHWEQMGEFT